jgi:hypothetical protein
MHHLTGDAQEGSTTPQRVAESTLVVVGGYAIG